MTNFEQLHERLVVGKLHCFDRLIFKGHLTYLYGNDRRGRPQLQNFLASQGVWLKDFGAYAKDLSTILKDHAQAVAKAAHRPYLYQEQTVKRARGQSKEDYVRELAANQHVREGLVCVLATVEPCQSFELVGNREQRRLLVQRRRRKCLHFYFYYLHPRFGLCHVRLQSWFPFAIQIWINGHAALAQALSAGGLRYALSGNAFTSIEHLSAAQRLADKLASGRWVRHLNALAREVNPLLTIIRQAGFGGYYWSVDQSEVATDLVFRARADLEQLLPSLFEHATTSLGAEDILRFFRRQPHPALTAELTTSSRHFQPGWRVKHALRRNTIKLYDKATCLRVETTCNNPRELRAWRTVTRVTGPGHRRRRVRRRQLVPLRKGVANLRAIYRAGIIANERYLDALAGAPNHGHAIKALDRLGQPRVKRQHRYPRLEPFNAANLRLFRAVLVGEHTITGFSNRDLRRQLDSRPPVDATERQRRCAAASRLIAKLRGHGLVAKVPHRRRYRPTKQGLQLMTAILTVHDREIPTAYAAAA